MKKAMSSISVYSYTNYRDFLRDCFADWKARDRSFSHKMILLDLGISSTGFLSNVVAGRKNLTPIQVAKLSRILKQNRADAAFFETLVQFTQSRTIEEKEEYFSRMIRLQKLTMKTIDDKKMSLFSRWYYVAIREMLNFYHFSGDIDALSGKLDPPIKPSEAKDAIEQLGQMGLIQKDTDGCYRQVDAALTTGDEVKSMHLAAFQLKTMDLAKRALVKMPATHRDISVLTCTLSEDTFRLVKAEIQNFRKRIAKIAVDERNPDSVYQMNIQFFPITRKKDAQQ